MATLRPGGKVNLSPSFIRYSPGLGRADLDVERYFGTVLRHMRENIKTSVGSKRSSGQSLPDAYAQGMRVTPGEGAEQPLKSAVLQQLMDPTSGVDNAI